MKKGLRIQGNFYINMDHIIEWSFDKDSLRISTVLCDGDYAYIIVADSIKDEDQRCSHKVTVNELHRIKREIAEYMGVDQQERLSSVK